MEMQFDLNNMPKVLSVYLRLSEYPILARKIRKRMRKELFARGVITSEQFEREVREKAIRTQQKEGLSNPMLEESPEEWAERLRIIRDHLTDFYFALNLPFSLFEEIVREAIQSRKPNEDVVLTFNPELAPWDLLFAQAEEFEKLPPEKKAKVRHHLQQIIAVITRGMISDQLSFVGVARKYFNIQDMKLIHSRRVGRGKIGGKAAGMMLAYKVLKGQLKGGPEVAQHVVIPESYFLGSDVFYDFLDHNELFQFYNQKYRPYEDMVEDYPAIREAFLNGKFPEDVIAGIRDIMERLGNSPIIVRSSSLLEDNFGISFAGKYDSFFLPNRGTAEENLAAMLDAIKKVYASTLNPNALLYRQQVGLVDYDERMAVLIQRVQGSQFGQYYFPTVAGVAFSQNPFRWSPKIRREDGFLRMVMGIGTRAVDRVANDYPRMVALSHPQLRPEVGAKQIRKYSQKFIDVIDLEANSFRTLPVSEVISMEYPGIELLASVDHGDYIEPIHSLGVPVPPESLVLTFDRLLRERRFTDLMKAILKKLESAYGRPVDLEFTLEIVSSYPRPEFRVHLLQCRPLSSWEDESVHKVPAGIRPEDIVFTSERLVPEGIVQKVEYVVYVPPKQYAEAPDYSTKYQIGRVVGKLNHLLAGKKFILVGPGRWGSSNIDLGVRVAYADIYNASMLIEVAFAGASGIPEVSYGTHFFQDLVEARIYPLSLYPDERDTVFRREFFEETRNVLPELLPEFAEYSRYVRVIDVREASGGRLLEVIMDSEEERAVGYLRDYRQTDRVPGPLGAASSAV